MPCVSSGGGGQSGGHRAGAGASPAPSAASPRRARRRDARRGLQPGVGRARAARARAAGATRRRCRTARSPASRAARAACAGAGARPVRRGGSRMPSGPARPARRARRSAASAATSRWSPPPRGSSVRPSGGPVYRNPDITVSRFVMLRRSRELASASKPHTISCRCTLSMTCCARACARAPRPARAPTRYRVAVVLEGGGMRGVVSAGMTAALERLGLTRCFDLVRRLLGRSAERRGAARRRRSPGGGDVPHGAGVAEVRQPDAAAVRPARARRAVRARPRRRRPRRRAPRADDLEPDRAATASRSTSTARGRGEFTGMRTKDELWQVLLATTRMPWIGGEPVPIGGRRYIDGALTCPIPVGNAIERRRDARAGAADAALRRAAVGRRADRASD